MSKEVKLGLAMVGALGLTLGAVFTMRMRAKDHSPRADAPDARQALAELKHEKDRMAGEREKPSLFSLGESPSPAGEAGADPASGREHHEHHRHDPFKPDAAADPAANPTDNSLVGDRYALPVAATPEARREEKIEEKREEKREERRAEREAAAALAAQQALQPPASDPFLQAGPAAMNNPMASGPDNMGAPPQATLSDGIAPASPTADPPMASPYGPPPADLSAGPLTRSPGDVRLDPNPDGKPHHNHHEKHEAEMLQTAGETPVGSTPPDARYGDSRYGDYRTPQDNNPYKGRDAAREQAIIKEMRRDEDRYRRQADQPAGAGSHQYDIYGRDIKGERDDPPPGAAPPSMPEVVAAPYSEDPLGRRSENIGRDGTDRAPIVGKYRVRPGDNFWTISQKAYGSGAYFKALEEHNREQFPYSDKLPVGQEVHVPPARELEQRYPDLCPRPRGAAALEARATTISSREGLPERRTYKVQEGDTLFDIARDQLGKASRWNEIYELNRAQLGEDFNFLSPGTELVLPSNRGSRNDADRDPLTTQARQPQTR